MMHIRLRYAAAAALAVLLWAKPGAGMEPPPWFGALSPYFARLVTVEPSAYALESQAEAARTEGLAAGALPDPTIGVGVAGLPTDGNRTREAMTQVPLVGLQQRIPYPGKLAARRAVGAAEADRLLATRRVRWEEEAYALAAATFAWRQLIDELAAVETTIGWFELLRKSAEARYRSGLGLAQDVDQINVQLGRLRAEAARLRARIAGQRSRWLRYLLTPPPATTPVDELEQPWEDLTEVAAAITRTAPRLHAADEAIARAEARLRLAQSLYGPDLAVDVGYGLRAAPREDLVTARIGISVPLWAPWSQRRRVAAAEAALAAARAHRQAVLAELEALATELVERHRQEVERQHLYQERILPDARAAAASAQGAYEAGGVDIFVPIAAIERLLDARRDLARVVAKRRTIEARVAALAGHLIGREGAPR